MAKHSLQSDSALHRHMVRRLSQFVARGGDISVLVDLSQDLEALGQGSYRVVEQVLPTTRFRSEGDVERIAGDLELVPGVGPANVRSEMSGIFYELALNAVQHSQSAVGEYAVLQYAMGADGEVIYAIGVADCGMGIPVALRQNPEFADVKSDADAVALATELHVTGTGDSRRGLGLDHVANTVRRFNGNFIIVSGWAYWSLKKGIEIENGTLSLTDRLPGTVATVTLSVPPLR